MRASFATMSLCVSALLPCGAAHAQTAPVSIERAPYLPEMGGSGYSVPVRSLQQMRRTGTLLQQYDFSCGSAAVATLLTHHYGTPTTEADVFESMFATGDRTRIQREGFSLLDMKRYLKTRGFEADGFEQPLDKLREARVPAIALVTEAGYHHFVVVKGLDRDRVLIGDPATGTRAVSRADFNALWKHKLLFVIHNRMDGALFNVAADWRIAPSAPLADGVMRDAIRGALPRNGPGQF